MPSAHKCRWQPVWHTFVHVQNCRHTHFPISQVQKPVVIHAAGAVPTMLPRHHSSVSQLSQPGLHPCCWRQCWGCCQHPLSLLPLPSALWIRWLADGRRSRSRGHGNAPAFSELVALLALVDEVLNPLPLLLQYNCIIATAALSLHITFHVTLHISRLLTAAATSPPCWCKISMAVERGSSSTSISCSRAPSSTSSSSSLICSTCVCCSTYVHPHASVHCSTTVHQLGAGLRPPSGAEGTMRYWTAGTWGVAVGGGVVMFVCGCVHVGATGGRHSHLGHLTGIQSFMPTQCPPTVMLYMAT